ncbi:hybrid sensor histidine kinase/response regulator [Leptolyngbya sp. FACHB-321]|uniref:ATP-binding response regulator n=1 Tax=Leptolyngbya sp. FACHB-321 TaxID=2692807 RepID=UPI0016868D79|nr:hybrid sensor histidine kinase/response regulator [Leptolyngbya sp. FACHB-321]MBD2037182.1 hybrid sensor histidine kinase/response regulator [Leptolyngbya sp. FACHB-321]
MVLSIPSLQAFVDPVPCCAVTARLTTALAVLGQAASAKTTAVNRLVLVDERQHPIGWVSAQQLLHYLAAAGLFSQEADVSDDRPLVTNQRTADLLVLDVMPSIVEPLLTIAANWTIDAFLPHLQAQPHACYALVDAEGCFLGLLDSARLLQFLMTRVMPPAPYLEAASVTALLEPSHPKLSPLLRELVERLPLPVMVQTCHGQVLAQNSIWRTQISELLDPGWLRHEVATLLEMPLLESVVLPSDREIWSALGSRSTSQGTNSAQSLPLALKTRTGTATPEAYDLGDDSAGIPAALPTASSCQLGTKPGTCICVCPLKDGQEQVLQFVRVPLGSLSAQTALDWGDRAQTLVAAVEAPFSETPFSDESASPSQLFRLAALLSTIHDPADTVSSFSRKSCTDDSVVPAAEELWLILAQDVTEQQQLARELTAKNADLIQLNRLKDEFLACISHELRTPLTSVLGLSSLLKDQTLGALNPRQVHYARLIHQSGRHLMAVVNDILDLTRIETGQLELVLAPVNLETVCRRAFEQAQQLQLQEGNQTETEPEPEQPMFSLTLEPDLGLLIADEQRLRQMLSHLLANALKFTESHDPIGLKVGHWGGWIAFTVWDTGIGIPSEKQHLIFQKFQQLENPLTRRFEGTGLGLVLTQRLARLHGGDITFVSKEGEGSQFTILLPPHPPGTDAASTFTAVPKTVAASEVGRSYPPRSKSQVVQDDVPGAAGAYAVDVAALQRSQLVLIVEASRQCLEALSDQLTGLGYRVVIARSGTEALEKARRLQPCIIFLNPVLPLLSGWDVLTLLKSNAETQQIPVVMMATKVDEGQARQRQSDSLLSVPIQPKSLQKCLQTLVVDRQKATLNPRPPAVLTILRLNPGVWSHAHQPLPTAELNALLHSYPCRILEADDLEQAELLARVWKPNVILLDGALADAEAYFQQYRRHIVLASLPLVTIDQATSQAANQISGLLVFPCLSPPETLLSANASPHTTIEASTLLQVIQVAAGYAWRPSILALDTVTLPLRLTMQNLQDQSARGLDSFPQETEWLQALTHYLNTAGLSSVIGRCWQEVLQQLELGSVDVLVLCWTNAIAQPFTLSMLFALQQLPKRPPILVLDHRHHGSTAGAAPLAPLPEALKQIAAHILPASLPMTELLQHMHQAIKVKR